MSIKAKQALVRFGKVVGVGVLAASVAFLSGPDAVGLLGTQYAVLAGAVLVPVLSALEKFLSGPTEKV